MPQEFKDKEREEEEEGRGREGKKSRKGEFLLKFNTAFSQSFGQKKEGNKMTRKKKI